MSFRLLIRRARRTCARAGHEDGQALVELAGALSLLFLLLLGIISFGTAFSNQITLTSAASNAAQVLMSGAGVVTDPCASANSAFAAAAANLNNPSIYGHYPLSFTITAYTTSSDSTSSGAQQVVFSSSGGPSCDSLASSLTQYQQVVVAASYGCNLSFFGYNFAPECKLTAQSSEAVQ